MRKITVIGGGLAGLIASIRLSRAGSEIVLIEKHEYPRHKVCGEYISMEVYDFLCREDLMPAAKLPMINKLLLSSPKGSLSTLNLKSGGFGISRYFYENFLYHKAIEAGVNIVYDEVININRGNSFFIETKKGQSISSDFVIGAYGKRTKLDKVLKRNFFSSHSPYVGVKFHAHYPGHDPHLIALHNFPGGYCGICNVENGITNFCYLVHRNKLRMAGSIEALEDSILYKNPFLKEALTNAERKFKKPLVINEISFNAKKPVKNGIIMIGDAAGMITPLCGNGMAMAIHTAKLLSDLILNNPGLTLEDLAVQYEKDWKMMFETRLAWGRFIQRCFFGKKWASALAVAFGNKMPVAANYLITKTHGNKI